MTPTRITHTRITHTHYIHFTHTNHLHLFQREKDNLSSILHGRRGTFSIWLGMMTCWGLASTWTFTTCNDVLFAWQAGHCLKWIAFCVARAHTWLELMTRWIRLGCGWSPHTLPGRGGTFGHGPSIFMAAVALTDMNYFFVWKA